MQLKSSLALLATACVVAACADGGKKPVSYDQLADGADQKSDQGSGQQSDQTPDKQPMPASDQPGDVVVQPAVATPSRDRLNFDKTMERGLALWDKYWYEDAVGEEDLPTSGKATYKGVTAFAWGTPITDFSNAPNADRYTNEQLYYSDRDFIRSAAFNSDITINADFADNTFDGHLDNFRTNIDNPIDGTVSITKGDIADGFLSGELSGILSEDTQKYRLTGVLSGEFVGEDAVSSFGAIAGIIDSGNQQGDFAGIYDIEGYYGAEAQ